MFHSKQALVAVLLTLTLLAAPAAIASPGADAPLTWMSWVEDVVSDLYGFLGLAQSTDLKSESADDGDTTTAEDEPVLTFGTDSSGPHTMTQSDGDGSGTEMGPVAQPNG